MQKVPSSINRLGGWLWSMDWRVKMSFIVTLILLLLVYNAVLIVNVPRLHILGSDTCDVWRAKYTATWAPTSDEWWDKLCFLEREMEKTDYHCSDSRWVDSRLVCFDSNLIPENNCLVYSFGIDFNFRFDDAIAKHGCTVYSFDPSMNVSDHQRSDRVTFKATGLSASDDDRFVPRIDGYVKGHTTWRMRRLSSIMKELGHSPGSLTLVKIDIEAYEWDVIDNLLSEGLMASIPQFLVEWHLFKDFPPRSRYDELTSIYFRFRATGFKKFYMRSEGREHSIDALRTQAETSWVNTKFLKPPA